MPNDEERFWSESSEKREESRKGSFVQILGSFKPFRARAGGIWEAWGAGGAESFLRKWGEKGGFWGSYWHFWAKNERGYYRCFLSVHLRE